MNLSPLPVQRFYSNIGLPLVGGKLFTYVANTTTKIATYQNSSGTLNTNPIILNFRGEANIWLDPTLTYKFVLAPATDTDPPTNPIWTVDNIAGPLTIVDVTRQFIGRLLWPRTAGEIAASVTPTDFAVPPVTRIEGNLNRFGALGAGNDTAILQAAINSAPAVGGYVFIPQDLALTSSIVINGKIGLTIEIERNAIVTFTDGAYVGFEFKGSSQLCKIIGGQINGSNHSTPTITLIESHATSAYFVLEQCNLAYASIGVLLNNTYICRLINNQYSNCDTFVKVTNSEGSVADIALIGETYGTSSIGSNAAVDILCPNSFRMVSGYFETQTQTKQSLLLRTGSQNIYIDASLENSGDIEVQNSVSAHMNARMHDAYSSSNNWSLRVAGGGSAFLDGGYVTASSLQSSVTGISSSGNLYMNDSVEVNHWGTGISISGDGTLRGLIDACTNGIVINSGSTAVLSNECSFSGNTTNVTNNSGGTAQAPSSFTGTLTGYASGPTTTCRYEVNNGVVELQIVAASGTSNATSMTLTGLPTVLQPLGGINVAGSVVGLIDNGTYFAEGCTISGSVITFTKNGSATGFTNSGTKGLQTCNVSWRLRNV